MSFTPQFIDFCRRNYDKLNPLTSTGEIRPFPKADAVQMLKDLESCNQFQLQYIHEFANKSKIEFVKHVQGLRFISAAKQAEIDAYNQFFADLEKKVEAVSKHSANNPRNTNNTNSSYAVKPLSGQSIYDSMMHILGYDATTVGASAMFFMAFSALRFLVGTPYWEQLAEYNEASPEKRFDPKNLTDKQIEMNLNEDSTIDQILQAGFLPVPNLAHAFDVEFKSYMQKMGNLTKQQSEDRPNQLGYGLLHPK
jgi:hypothetical protein